MNYEELKAEAKMQGYNLVKRQGVRLKHCPICGKKPIKWHNAIGVAYKCESHENVAFFCKGDRKARIAWNEWVERRKDE